MGRILKVRGGMDGVVMMGELYGGWEVLTFLGMPVFEEIWMSVRREVSVGMFV
jgi:hypothetical protein